ncbi:glycoside hydrolase family 92 protein [candidate division KSB1 bacterium]|nr:glycoside hydrolase family 92 protein [candidate division KSB1 bacterium]
MNRTRKSKDWQMTLSDYFSPRTHIKEPVDHVDPRIGGISHMLVPTFPTVHLPNSMVRMQAEFTPNNSDWMAATKIYGFGLNLPAHRGSLVTTVMPACGELVLDADHTASAMDHDLEIVTPYHYGVYLEDPEIIVDMTPAARGGGMQFTPLHDNDMNLIFRCKEEGFLEWLDDQTLRGWELFRGVRQYFYAKLSKPAREFTVFAGLKQSDESALQGKEIGAFARFPVNLEERVWLSYAISFIDLDQAEKNYRHELEHSEFDTLRLRARQKWNDTLSRIEVHTDNPARKRSFYTALYRSFERMVNITEDGRYYSAYDNKVHCDDRPFYVDDWIWDTYRSTHPLRLLLAPQMEQDMIQSYVRMYEQSEWLPTFPQIFGDAGAMIGHHQAAFVTDVYRKGYRDFDIETAYEGLKKNATQGTMIPWREGPATELDKIYREKGFFPGLAPGEKETEPLVDDFEGRQSVSVTLDHAYDDWCLAQLARKLGKHEDAERFTKRGQNWRHVFHPDHGFVVPKDKDGNWIEPFDPRFTGDFGGRKYFAEMNSWIYTWHIQHDIDGLIEVMGGNEQFLQKLEQLFHEPLGVIKYRFLSQFPDSTGLVGQYAAGNEQSFHIPYLFNHAGAPWKTQKRIRQIMDLWFRDDVMGICGDEDGGALSSWYAFSAMGFYPTCPGSTRYDIGSPVFEKTEIHLGNGKTLTLIAENVSACNKYIQSMTIDGQPWYHAWLEHEQIMAGGEIVFQMGSRPNKEWGIEKK